MPDIGGRSLKDITFTDSLTGYVITTRLSLNDTSFILKTTNGGDNWIFNHSDSGFLYQRIQFINKSTGYVGGQHLIKTTNAGENWTRISNSLFMDDLYALNEDTMWLAKSESLTGGVFRTTNGGVNWTQQFSGGTNNPDKIYMYNSQIGFIARNTFPPVNNRFYKTTNGGQNWFNVNNDGFRSMHFVDSLTGWKATGLADSSMKKTTDGGSNWIVQQMPSGGFIESNVLTRFSVINRDTLLGCGGYLRYPNNQIRGIIYRTTNGGSNWHYQVPDTSLPIVAQYEFIRFSNSRHGWVYANFPTYVSGLHTTTGGDTNWITGINQLSTELPTDFQLYQNYPNPFNPTTNLKFKIKNVNLIKLSVYDITGRELVVLINDEKMLPGEYRYTFNGSGLPSGVYFYSLFVDNKLYDTKKMMLVK